MLDIKNNDKTLKIISRHILNTDLVLKCILKGVKAKKDFFMNVVFLSNHQTINIYLRHRSFSMCFSNQNSLINIGQCHSNRCNPL